jgi:demethylmenaquinone methyltransferase/2-methoxy-6-polyprenyl-1,4-benzoquinol methylase
VTAPRPPAFARDPATARYYEARAEEYDEWYEGRGRFADRDRPGWTTEVRRLLAFVRDLAPARTLDVACGTGFLTRHLRGPAVGLDRSAAMLDVTRRRIAGPVLVADALTLPFAHGAFERVLTGHFYGHLSPAERAAFLAEARRVAAELIVVDSALRDGVAVEQWQERVLNDGSRHQIYKRYPEAGQLAAEIGGEVALDGTWFVAARAAW